MRYKNSDDNRYRVQFMRSTEELMDQLTVKEFISYLEENAEFEDYTVEYIDGKCVKCRAYDLKEADSKLHKEFLVTEDGRVFYWRSLISKIELVDREETKEVKETRNMKSKEFEGLLKSEVKKIERAANKLTGFTDCKCTAYGSKVTRPFDFDPDAVFVDIEAEICRNYEDVVPCIIQMSIPMFDRRKSFITRAEMI